MRKFQLSLKSLLGLSLMAGVLFATIYSLVAFDWRYAKVVSIEFDGERKIHLYEERFWEFSRTVVFDIEDRKELILKKSLLKCG